MGADRLPALEAVAEAARHVLGEAMVHRIYTNVSVNAALDRMCAALARLDATPATAADELSAALARFSAAMGEEHVVISATAKRQYDAAYEREFSREAAKHGATVKFFGPNGWEECDAATAAQPPTPTDETVKRLRALLEKATPGPWHTQPQVWEGEERWWCLESEGLDVLAEFEGTPRAKQDAELCAEARNALPALLDAADLLCRLERMNDIHERRNDIAAVPPLRLEDALEAARREQARERGSDGR